MHRATQRTTQEIQCDLMFNNGLFGCLVFLCFALPCLAFPWLAPSHHGVIRLCLQILWLANASYKLVSKLRKTESSYASGPARPRSSDNGEDFANHTITSFPGAEPERSVKWSTHAVRE
ncbi:hypothetical protein M0802_006882 [Mischocyttarus mexicanus]|nr:hypothetical protein M0802_006882 [Mischocyttarus mexicanus]